MDPKVQSATESDWCSAPSVMSESGSKLCSQPSDSPAPPLVPVSVDPLAETAMRSVAVESAPHTPNGASSANMGISAKDADLIAVGQRCSGPVSSPSRKNRHSPLSQRAAATPNKNVPLP